MPASTLNVLCNEKVSSAAYNTIMIIEKSINAVRIIDAIYIAEKKRRALMTNYLVKRFIAIRSERRISQESFYSFKIQKKKVSPTVDMSKNVDQLNSRINKALYTLHNIKSYQANFCFFASTYKAAPTTKTKVKKLTRIYTFLNRCRAVYIILSHFFSKIG